MVVFEFEREHNVNVAQNPNVSGLLVVGSMQERVEGKKWKCSKNAGKSGSPLYEIVVRSMRETFRERNPKFFLSEKVEKICRPEQDKTHS